jgi:ribonuclease HI
METSFHNIEDRNPQGLGWAAATRPLRLLRKQLESVLGKKARQHRRVLDIPDDTWDLLWDGEQALKEAGPHLWRANHKTVRLTKRRTPLQIPQALLPTNGKATQHWQANIPTIKALSAHTQATLQAYLELVDWPTETHTAPQKQTIPWSWANDSKTASPSLPSLTQQQLNTIATHMNKTDKKQLLSHLAQVKGTEHLAQITTEMSKRMWTMKKTHSMEEDSPIWKLFPGTAALWEALQTHFNLPHTPEQSRGPSDWMDEFNNATNICWKCQCRKTAVCKGNLCQTPRCLECEKICSVCNVTPDHQPDSKRKCPQDAPASVSSHTMGIQLYEKTGKARFTTPTHMSGKNNVRKQLLQTLFTPDDEGAYFRRKPNPDKELEATTDDDSEKSSDEGSAEGPISPQHPSQNLLNPLPRSTAEGGHLEFRMQVRGWQDKAHVARAIHMLTLPDSALLKTMEHSTFPVLIPQHLFPQNPLPHQEYGWWYIPTAEVEYRTCPTCKKRTPKAHFHTRGEDPLATCKSCPTAMRPQHARHSESFKKRTQHSQIEQGQRDALDRTSYELNERIQARWQGGRVLWDGTVTAISNTRPKTYTITYIDDEVEEGVSLDLIRPAPIESTQEPSTQKGLALRTTDPRSPADGDVILTPMELRNLLEYQQHLPDQKAWATTAEAGFPLEEEEEEIRNERDEREGKRTARFLHPAISDMAQLLNGIENQGQNLTKTQRAVIQLDNDWMNPAYDPHVVKWHRKWEKNPPPPRAKDPPRIQDYQEKSLKLGSTFHLDHPRPNTTEHGIIHIEVESKLWIDNYEGTEIYTKAGLSTSTDLACMFTILCGTWAHLQARTAPGRRPHLTQEIAEACRTQEELESTDHRTPTRHVLRALKKCTKAQRIHGLTSVVAPGFFKNASRGPSALWGEKNVNDIVIYVWDSMDNTDRENSLQDIQEAKSGLIWKERDDTWSEKLLAAGLTKIPIITNKKIRAQGIREKGWWRTGELKTSMTPANHKLECWTPTPLPPHTQSALINALQQALQAPSNTDNKDECILDLIGPEKDYWNGTEAGRLKAYNFPGTCAAGDGSNHEKTKTMGAGFCTLKELHWGRRDLRDRAKILRHNARYCAGVGRGNEGASSNRAEHAALLLCLRKTHRTQDLLYLTDSESLLKTISKWIGEGTRANLATTPDGDIVREIVQILQERVTAGANTFLIKIKAHRGEPLNEAADSRAEQGRTAHTAEDTNEYTPKILWDHPSGKTIFSWQKDTSSIDDQDPERKTRTWGNAARAAMRAAGAKKELEKATNTSTTRWLKTNFPKGEPPTSEGLRAFQDHTWKDKKRWLEYILKNHQDTHPLPTTSYSPFIPATSTKTTDFFMREPSCRQAISKYLKSSSERTEDKRRLIQIITNSFPVNAFTSKFKKGKSNRCDICRRALQATGAITTEEDLQIQTVGHITGYCLGQTDAITAAHHSVWKTLHSGIAHAAPKGWEFPSEKGELTIGQLWADNKMDEICTKDNLWETAQTSEMQRTLTPTDEEICKAAKNPKQMRESMARKRFFRTRPDGIAHHNEKRIWYLMEFKRTSDVLPDYLERKDKMASKQYETFMEILRKAKKPGWTTDQLNFIVGSKTINENAMDTNMERLGINQKKKQKIKAATAKANIHGLLNILKAYYANTHQDSPKPQTTEGTESLKLTIDTRQALGKRAPYTNQNGTETLPAKGKHTKRQDYEGAYTSLIPQVNYSEEPAHNSLPSSARKLLQAPSRASPKRPRLDQKGPPPCPTTTGLRSPKKAKTEAPKPLDYTPQMYASSNPPAYNGAPHTRKRPPEDNPQSVSKKHETAFTPGNGE